MRFLREGAGEVPDAVPLRVLAGQAPVVPGSSVEVEVLRAGGAARRFTARAAVETQLEAALLREGGVLPTSLRKTLAER